MSDLLGGGVQTNGTASAARELWPSRMRAGRTAGIIQNTSATDSGKVLRVCEGDTASATRGFIIYPGGQWSCLTFLPVTIWGDGATYEAIEA